MVGTSVGRDDVPRYLFRAYSNKSFGYNDSTEMIPTAFNEGVGHKSIFHVPEQERQKMLSDHLAWSRDTCSDFLSWSSSLLFVLIHGVRRKYYQKEEGVNICIMDTHEAKDNDVYPARMLVKLWGVDKPDDWYQSEYLVHGPLGSKRGAVYTTVPLDFFEGHGLYQLFPELYEGRESFELLKRVNRLRGTFSVLEDTPIDEVMVLIKTLTSSLLSTSAFSVPLAIAFLKLGARKHDDASLNQMIRHFSPFNFPSWMEIPREVARASALYEGACGLTEVSGFAKLLQAISIRRMAATIAQSTFTVESGQYPQPEVQGEFEALGQKQAGIGSGDQLIFKFEGLKVFDGEASKPLSSSDEASGKYSSPMYESEPSFITSQPPPSLQRLRKQTLAPPTTLIHTLQMQGLHHRLQITQEIVPKQPLAKSSVHPAS